MQASLITPLDPLVKPIANGIAYHLDLLYLSMTYEDFLLTNFGSSIKSAPSLIEGL